MDNFFNECPPMMSDGGRQFGDFKTATRRNEYIKYINDIYRDDRYRLFLQSNGKQILDREWMYHKENSRCQVGDCVHKYPTRATTDHFIMEKAAYESKSRVAMANKKCQVFKDYRLFPDDCV